MYISPKLLHRAPQPCGKEVKRSSGGAGAEPLRHGGPGAYGPRWGAGRSPVLLVSPNNCVFDGGYLCHVSAKLARSKRHGHRGIFAANVDYSAMFVKV